MAAIIKVKRGTASAWTSANPTLAAGEPGFETDTNKLKIGDGTTAWNSLAYFGAGVSPTPYAWVGSISGRSWALTSTTYSEFTSGAGTATLTEHTNINFGATPTVYNPGVSQPGITFTPPAIGLYSINILSYSRVNSANVTVGLELSTSAGTVIGENPSQITGSTGLNVGSIFSLSGFLQINSLSSLDLRLRAKASTGAININSDTQNRGYQINILKIN